MRFMCQLLIMMATLLLFTPLAFAPFVFADDLTIPLTDNLAADAAESKEKNLPIMLMVSGIDCPFCVRLKKEYLNPIMHNPDYHKKIIMREIIIDDGGAIDDFNGEWIRSHEISIRYDAGLTPTLLFLDHTGKELTKRVVGYTIPDMYGYYLDKAIDTALHNLRQGV